LNVALRSGISQSMNTKISPHIEIGRCELHFSARLSLVVNDYKFSYPLM
jgi:hypothetical protein